ncbi:MAG: PIN domain-containing protein [Nostocales cyanobacterium LacPavin_0920_SED1_MAG_38_18]|nr:PIN domain-containing protein [Nostocales cyanobacterium LacPavin_0920_SED1_MAG_38_18]
MNMRDLFPGYYQPTEQEFDELWNECIFSFDTNVLLNIYRYSPQTRERLFDILEKLQERIWVTHQVGYEFHKNRLTVISQQSSAYDKIGKILDENLKIGKIATLQKDLEAYKKHSAIEVQEILENIETALKEVIKSVKNNLQDLKQNHPDLLREDILQDKIIEILNGRIGSPYPDLLYIYKLAEERFKNLIPPGYKDKDNKQKSVPDIYGDAILWLQLIDYAKSEKKPIIFVTDDDKEDWWLESGGKTISPRPELVQEMLTEAGVKFYMYSADRFLDYAQKFLHLSEQPEVIEEAREIREQDEDYLSDVLEERGDLSKSVHRFNELEPTIAELRKISSGIAEALKIAYEIPKTNSPALDFTKRIAEISQTNSPALDFTKRIAEISKTNSPALDFTKRIAEISKINSPALDFTKRIAEISKINSQFSKRYPFS